MKKSFSIILLYLLIGGGNLCQGQALFNFDYSVFHGENGNSILEIYYSVDQSSLTYSKTQQGFESAAKIDVTIFDIINNKNLFSNVYKSPSLVTDTSESALNQKLVGQMNYIISPGNYKIKITGWDFNDTAEGTQFEHDLIVNETSNEKIDLSDIQFSTLIENSSDNTSMFYKNTLEVIPNPSNLFGMNLNNLYYYYEIYGLTDDNISNEFIIDLTMLDLNNVSIISQKERAKKSGKAKAKFGKIGIDSLKRGTYTFRVTILDSVKNVNLVREKKFYIFNKLASNINSSSTDDNDFLKSEYGAMPKDQVNNELEKSLYLRSEQENDKVDELTNLEGKRKYLYAFWKLKDTDPDTPVNDFKVEYFNRVKEANSLYKEPYKEGWKTDRGRIYILYGKPDDVDKYPFQSNTKSYEIWKYHSLQGGGECVFVEKQSSTGVYWLVHSTFRNELRNDGWTQELN